MNFLNNLVSLTLTELTTFMSDDSSSNNTGTKRTSWFEKISQVFFGAPQDKNDLRGVFEDAKQRQIIDNDDFNLLEGAMAVSELQLRDIMIPRSQVVWLHQEASLHDILPIIKDTAHSRYPVLGESRDEVAGVLLVKDLLRAVADGSEYFKLTDYLRPPVFVPESKRCDVMLREFQRSQNHMAIVIDEYGHVAGLVTIEDVLEQIVGEIEDEHDAEDEHLITPMAGKNTYTVNAITTLEEFNEHFNASLEEDDIDTIAGLVIHKLGHLPRKGERVVIDSFQFEILTADKRRIRTLKLVIKEDDESMDI